MLSSFEALPDWERCSGVLKERFPTATVLSSVLIRVDEMRAGAYQDYLRGMQSVEDRTRERETSERTLRKVVVY